MMPIKTRIDFRNFDFEDQPNDIIKGLDFVKRCHGLLHLLFEQWNVIVPRGKTVLYKPPFAGKDLHTRNRSACSCSSSASSFRNSVNGPEPHETLGQGMVDRRRLQF